MSLTLHAVATHVADAGGLGVRTATRFLGGVVVPNPPAQAPPTRLVTAIDTVIGWGKWLVMASGVAGLLICGGKMTIGHRNRASFAADGATGIPWVLAGISVAAVAAAIVGVFL